MIRFWVSGFEKIAEGASTHYGWIHNVFNGIFGSFGWETFKPGTIVDGFSGATPMALAYNGGWERSLQYFLNIIYFGEQFLDQSGKRVKY